FIFFFFFSSRRRHTRFDCDWSSDVCSSDLLHLMPQEDLRPFLLRARRQPAHESGAVASTAWRDQLARDVPFHCHERSGDSRSSRSEERRVGKEWRCRWSAEQYTRK